MALLIIPSLLLLLLTLTNGMTCNLQPNEIPIYDAEHTNALIFRSKYLNKNPVIINSNPSDWFTNTKFFSIKNLYLNYGNDAFQCGTSTDLAKMIRPHPDEITLSLYLRKSKYKHYQIFDPFFIANNAQAIGLKSLKLFKQIDTQLMNAYTFLIGKVGSGISFQSHGSIWWHQIKGKTKTFLYPPSFSPIGGALDWTTYSSQQWNDQILPYLSEPITAYPKPKEIHDKDISLVFDANISSIADIFDTEKHPFFTAYKPFECVVSEGQLLYIPKLWWYSTLNVRNEQNLSVAMVMQTDDIPKAAGLSRRGFHDSLRTFSSGFDYLYQHNNAEDAQSYFARALMVDPTFVSAYVALVDIYMQAAQKNKEHLDIVLKFMKTAYLLNPEYEVVREGLEALLRDMGEYELAEKVEQKLPL